jgi:hypothetical protein
MVECGAVVALGDRRVGRMMGFLCATMVGLGVCRVERAMRFLIAPPWSGLGIVVSEGRQDRLRRSAAAGRSRLLSYVMEILTWKNSPRCEKRG